MDSSCEIKSKLHKCSIHYAHREDSELAIDKLAYLHKTELEQISFEGIAQMRETSG